MSNGQQPRICSRCGRDAAPAGRFCRLCGGSTMQRVSLTDEDAATGEGWAHRCPACSGIQPTGSSYCGDCGAALVVEPLKSGGDNPGDASMQEAKSRSPSGPGEQSRWSLEAPGDQRTSSPRVRGSEAHLQHHPLAPARVEPLSVRDGVSDEQTTVHEPVDAQPGEQSSTATPVLASGPGSGQLTAWLAGHRKLVGWAGVATGLLAGAVALALQVGRPSRAPTGHALNPSAPDVGRVLTALRQNDGRLLYDAVAVETRAGATQTEFAAMVRRQSRSEDRITSATASGPVRARSRQGGTGIGSLVFYLGYQHHASKPYTAYFLKEDGRWRLWFTRPAR